MDKPNIDFIGGPLVAIDDSGSLWGTPGAVDKVHEVVVATTQLLGKHQLLLAGMIHVVPTTLDSWRTGPRDSAGMSAPCLENWLRDHGMEFHPLYFITDDARYPYRMHWKVIQVDTGL